MMIMTHTRKLSKGEEKDWAWELVGMTPSARQKMMEEQIKRDYSPSDVRKIKTAFVNLARGK